MTDILPSIQPSAGTVEIPILPGISMTIRPVDTFQYLLADEKAARLLEDAAGSIERLQHAGVILEPSVDMTDPIVLAACRRFIIARELAATHIVAWKGVRLEEGDAAAELNPDNARAAMAHPEIFNRFYRYALTASLERQAAKKECGAAPAG